MASECHRYPLRFNHYPGEIVAMASTLEDELVVAKCDLADTALSGKALELWAESPGGSVSVGHR